MSSFQNLVNMSKIHHSTVTLPTMFLCTVLITMARAEKSTFKGGLLVGCGLGSGGLAWGGAGANRRVSGWVA